MHRITYWHNDRGDVIQVALCCLDSTWEAWAEITERVGPFDDVPEILRRCEELAHSVGGWRAHQLELFTT